MRKRPTINCQIPECDHVYRDRKSRLIKGYCGKHYQRFIKHGDASFTEHPQRELSFRDRFWSSVALTANPDRCWNWQKKLSKKGYGHVILPNRITVKAHRAAWFLVKGVFPELCLLHSCDNPQCVNPNHLREGTRVDNNADKMERRRQAKGETCARSKTTESNVREIRQKASAGWLNTQLAKTYGLSPSAIGRIVNRGTWGHVA